MAAAVRMEPQDSGGRQRRVRRHDAVSGVGHCRQGRLCGCGHRHRPRRRQRGFRPRASRKARGLRVSRDPRDDGDGENDRDRTLRYASVAGVLQFVLDGRAPGPDRSAALSRRLRRHRRWRPVLGSDAAVCRARLAEHLRQPLAGGRHPGEQVSDDSPGGARQVRCARWRERRCPRGSVAMLVRLRDVEVHRWRSSRLPDHGSGRDRGGHDIADPRSEERRFAAPWSLLSWIGTRMGRCGRTVTVRRIA